MKAPAFAARQTRLPVSARSRRRHRALWALAIAFVIYWQKQPGAVSDVITVKWSDRNGHFYTSISDLAQDRVISFSARGVSIAAGHAAQAKLPSLSLG